MVLDIDRWFDLNIDLDSRTIYMGKSNSYEESDNSIDHSTAEYMIKAMHVLESKNHKPITIIMNSPGGDWYHGMAIYDAIKCSSCECTIKVYGYAMSMGSVILQAAKNRILMPNSRFMFHYGDEGVIGQSKIVQSWADEGKRINWQMENIYLDQMLTSEKLKKTKLDVALAAINNRRNSLTFSKKQPISYKLPTYYKERRESIRTILSEMLMSDTILTPEETISLGLADSIH